jgi:hypothetical protein
MGVVAITAISDTGIRYQWFTDAGKQRHEDFLPWAEIGTVDVFKRDLGVFDLICLQLSHAHHERVIEVDEEDVHWQELIDALPTLLPGCRAFAGWFGDVAFPAFDENRQRLFERG